MVEALAFLRAEQRGSFLDMRAWYHFLYSLGVARRSRPVTCTSDAHGKSNISGRIRASSLSCACCGRKSITKTFYFYPSCFCGSQCAVRFDVTFWWARISA